MEQSKLKLLIPEENLQDVEKALKQTFNTRSVENIVRLPGSFIAALVYMIVIGGRRYILKIIKHINPLNDPVRQFVCLDIAAQAGIAPRVYYSNPQDALYICDFIEEKPFAGNFPSREDLIDLVKIIKSIQATPLFPKRGNFLDDIDNLINEFRISEILPENLFEEHLRYYSQIQKVYPRDETDLVSSHNDLNAKNMLFDGKKIWIIDWDGAYQSDRYVDLAIVANNFVSSREQEEIYLRAYFGNSLDEYKRARFFLMKQICNMYYAMAVMKIALWSQKPDLYDDFTKTMQQRDFHTQTPKGEVSLTPYEWLLYNGRFFLNKALGNMKTDRFSKAIKNLI